MKIKWTARTAAVAMLSGAVALGAAVATVTVTSASVKMREKPTLIDPLIATASRGATLEVTDTFGAFSKVRFEGKAGWIRTADITRKSYAPPTSGSQYASGKDAGAAVESASGKGLTPGAAEYAASTGINPAALQKLIDDRDRIVDSGEYKKFADQAKVGKRYASN